MTEEYLIAHKVRGETAIDVAIQLEGAGTETDPGPWWIIPTSGHRAYPFWAMTLHGVYVRARSGEYEPFLNAVPEIPDGHPDHYAVNDRPFSAPKRKLSNLDDLNLEELGL